MSSVIRYISGNKESLWNSDTRLRAVRVGKLGGRYEEVSMAYYACSNLMLCQ